MRHEFALLFHETLKKLNAMADTNAKKRVSPMGPIDKALLAEIVKEWKDAVESKNSSASTVHIKNKAWTDVCKKFNSTSNSGIERSCKQLRKCYENMKATAKKANASHKRELYRTGGGPMPKDAEISEIDKQMLDLLEDSIHPVPNVFDDDASFHGDKMEMQPDEIVNVSQLDLSSASAALNVTASTSADQPVMRQSKKAFQTQNYNQLMEMERKEHELRIQYWNLKIQLLKEYHEAKMKKLSSD